MKIVVAVVVALSVVPVDCWWNRGPKTDAEICEENVTRLETITSELERFHFLKHVSKCAFDDGDYELARQLATESLELAQRFPEDWNYGNAVHDGNVVLGRIALLDGNSELAIEHLQKAGQTPGSPQLNSFGPNMTLARDLLQNGDWDPVYDYLEQCKIFWKLERGKIDRWQELVLAKQIPDFGANLCY
jgi:hypothetical protein